ncbi:MAG: hypothetical protein ACYC6X_02180 [Minisyncoccota bacterium]
MASKTLLEVEGKIFDRRYDWAAIDKELALKDKDVLELLCEACLVESYFAIYTGKMMELFAYDVEATSMYTIEAFEAYTHFYLLRRYLATIGYKTITDEEVVKLRDKDKDKVYSDEVRELVNFMGTEHFATVFFDDLSKRAEEPVLKKILSDMSRQEISHKAFAYELLEARLQKDPRLKGCILIAAKEFLHVGGYVLPRVSNAREDMVSTIAGFDACIKKLVGESVSEYSMKNKRLV